MAVLRGFCPSCGARRMVETAALLVDEILPRQPLRQWVLSVPFPLRFLFATEPAALAAALGKVGALTPEQARRRCERVLGNVAHGREPTSGLDGVAPLTLGDFIESTYAS